MSAASQCRNRPYRDVRVLDDARRQLLRAYRRDDSDEPPHDPLRVYELLFARMPDEYIRRRVRQLVSDARKGLLPVFDAVRHAHSASALRRRRPGYVYVFWSPSDDDDDASVRRADADLALTRRASAPFKVGATTQRNVERRMQQWRRELGDPHIELVFAERTDDCFLAEALVHRVLTCERLTLRVNRRTGRLLNEYFAVDDWRLLRILVALTARYTDWLLADTDARQLRAAREPGSARAQAYDRAPLPRVPGTRAREAPKRAASDVQRQR